MFEDGELISTKFYGAITVTLYLRLARKKITPGGGVCIDSEHYEKLSWRGTRMRGPTTAGPRPHPLPLVRLSQIIDIDISPSHNTLVVGGPPI